MANFVCQFDWVIRYLDICKTLFWMCLLWECFWMRIVFGSVDWVKQIALPNMGGLIQSVEDPNRTKGWSSHQVRVFPPSWLPWAGTLFFSYLWIKLKHWLFLGLKPASLWTGTHSIGSPNSQTFSLGLKLHCQLPWVSNLPTADFWTYFPPESFEPIP